MPNPFDAAARLVIAARNTKEAITSFSVLPRFSKASQWNKWDTKKAIDEGFKASVWVYTAITKISKSVGSVPWQVLERGEAIDDSPTPVPDSPATALLAKPNPRQGSNLFMRTLVDHLYLSGNAIIKKTPGQVRTGKPGRGPKTTIEMWPLNPADVDVKNARGGKIEYSVKLSNGKKMPIPTEEIIHFMFVDPANPLWGMSPLQAAAKIVDTDVKAISWNFTAMDNRAVPDGVFSFDQPLNREQWEEAKDEVKTQYDGPDNARTPWVLGSGARWLQMTMTPAEMDFIESRKLSREEILAVFEVPPPVVGIYDNATLANIETARKIFWSDTIVPVMDVFRDQFNLSLAPDFGIEGLGGSSWIAYDTTTVDAFQDNLVELVKAAQGLFELGIPMMQVNKILELGLQPWEGWDQSYISNRVVPAALAGMLPELTGRREGDE